MTIGIPVQALEELGAHVHIFGQSGTLGLLTGPGAESVSEMLIKKMRFSCGVGLVIPIPVGRVEVNLCRSLKTQHFDRVHNGLQVGLSASF